MSTVKFTTTNTVTACAHCGLPAPAAVDRQQPAFCCRGCQGAYELIRGWGLQEFYELSDATAGQGQVGDGSSACYEDLDDPTLLGRSAPFPLERSNQPTRLFQSRLSLAGLHCVACVWLIERAPERIAGWHSAKVNMHAREVDLIFDPQQIRLSQIGALLHRLGYRIAPLDDRSSEAIGLTDQQRMLIDIAIAGFCAANAMWVAIALYAGQYSSMAAGHTQVLRIAGVLLGTVAVVFPGRVFFRSAWASWVTRTPHMDLPVAVGLTAGAIASLYGLFDRSRDVYFDSIACLVLFLLVGRWIQMRSQRRAGEAVAELIQLSPAIASQLHPDGQFRRVPVDTLVIGDVVRIDPGQSIPIDGMVVKGHSSVDRSLLTGESRPVSVTPGCSIEAGTENLQAELLLRATAAPRDTRLAALTRAVAEAAETRTPVVQLANRIGGWFVVIVLMLAVITAVLWWQVDSSRATSNVVALLIVACPCALALATPLAIAVAIGRLARRHILVRDGECLERLVQPGWIYFDKTGTLTAGNMQLTKWFGESQFLSVAAGLERSIRHPIARALCAYADSQRVSAAQCIDVQQVVGRGVRGVVDGDHYEIGALAQMSSIENVDDSVWQSRIGEILDRDSSPIAVYRNGQVVAMFGVTDPVHPDAAQLVRSLNQRGWRVGILSGDHGQTVDKVAIQIGVAREFAQGDLLPADKLAKIRQSVDRGPVVMVGDGVNDAAALAAADVGIAIQGGAAASLKAAPVMIADGQLQRIGSLLDAAARTRQIIQRNFAVSIGYNLFAVTLAMTGTITPLAAAVLMPISSLTVLTLTLAYRTFPAIGSSDQ